MDTNRLKRFATEARNILMQGVVHRLTALGFLPDGSVTEEPQQQGGGATFMGDTVTQDFYDKWQSLRRAVSERKIEEVAEEAAYTWFNRLVAIRIMVKNGLASPVLEYESDDVLIPILVSEARQGRMPEMDDDNLRKLTALLDDDSKTNEQFALLIVAYCHSNSVINSCFGHISDYTELLLPANILAEGGFVNMLNNTEFISEEDFKSPELIGWLYQFYISEKKDDVFASFKKGKKAEAKDIPAATQIFTPNWIVKYMVQNTVGRIYLDNNPYSDIKESMKYLVEPEEPTPTDAIFRFDDIHDLTCADLACGSGHILNECFDLLYQLYIEEGYSRKNAIEDIFKYNLTGVDLDTRAKQLAQFALLLKACQKDASFADAHCMPKVLDMPKVDRYTYKETAGHFDCAYGISGDANIHKELVDAFTLLEEAENLGSIMKFEISESTRDYLVECIESYDAEPKFDDAFSSLLHAYALILMLTKKYAALVMNPPYMGSANMNQNLSQYAKDNYPSTKEDLFSIFMALGLNQLITNGKMGMINMQSWMFLSSFVDLRKELLSCYQLESLLNLGARLFDQNSVGTIVKNAAFVFSNNKSSYNSLFINCEDENNCEAKRLSFLRRDKKFCVNQAMFNKLEGYTFSFWISERIIDIFNEGEDIQKYIDTFQGIITGDNVACLRQWFEVSRLNTAFNANDYKLLNLKQTYWIPYNKGGNQHKWYGLQDYVINWSDDGTTKTRARTKFRSYYLRDYVAWSYTVSNFIDARYYPYGFLWDVRGSGIFDKSNMLHYLQGLIGCKVGFSLFKVKTSSLSCQVENICQLPVIVKNKEYVDEIVKHNISISKFDWDSHETSWDFTRNPLYEQFLECMEDDLQNVIPFGTSLDEVSQYAVPEAMHPLTTCMHNYKDKWEVNFMRLHENEEELNRQFIEIYGLQDELTPDVPLDEITILQQGEISISSTGSEQAKIVWHDDVIMKHFISYAVGCMMGRYSVDVPGLILANQGDGINEYNEKVANSRFEIDDDGIIPLMASDSDFSDNATLRFKTWLTVAFGEQHLVENLNFIEAALGKSLDDYFVKDFWKDHKKLYQNRPIYWLFSSKKGAFQCAVYMHRMNPYTAEKIRTDYLLPHIEWLVQKQNEMEANAANLSTAERKKLDNIRKQIDECREYHDRLHVIADEQIAFDLDDGVVVNYAKFGDVLAKLK